MIWVTKTIACTNITFSRVLDTPIVGFSWLGLHLFLRLIVAGTATMCTYNIANRIYDAVYSSVGLDIYQKWKSTFE